MKYKQFILAICTAAVLTLSACGTTNTVPSTEVPSLPASSVPAPEIPNTSVQLDSDVDTVETDAETESQDMEQENGILPPQAPETPVQQPEENVPTLADRENPLENTEEEQDRKSVV